MSSVKSHIQKLNKIKLDLKRVAKQAVIDNALRIEEILVESQLNKGLNAEGQLTGTYSLTTYEISQEPPFPKKDKIPGQPYNFEWSGDFINRIRINSKLYHFDIFSRDAKSDLLEREFGILLKLTKENNELVNREIIIPAVYKYILKNLPQI